MDYEPLEVIGHGSFGVIRKVRRVNDGEILVRKEICYKAMNQKERTQLIAEFRILKSLHHPNIVQYLHHEHIHDVHEVHLYQEYCSDGDLSGLIRAYKLQGLNPPEHDVWTIFTQLVLALYRCHYMEDAPQAPWLFGHDNSPLPQPPSSFVLHRDIKPENIFLAGGNRVKLGDFGLAKLLDLDNPLATTYVGTPYYMSPEVLTGRPATPASDVWSLGCVIYELCALRPPFTAKSHLHLSELIREGIFPQLPSCYSQTLAKTISMCLTTDGALRPTCATLLRLDILKICRRELELNQFEGELIKREEAVRARENAVGEQSFGRLVRQAPLRGPRLPATPDSRLPLDEFVNHQLPPLAKKLQHFP